MSLHRLYPGIRTGLWLLPVLTVVQVGLGSHFGVNGLTPAIVLIAVVNWGILRGMDEGIMWAFFGGLCLDVFTGWPFGTNTLGLVVVASLVSLGQSTFMRTHGLVPIGTVLVATILYYLVALFILTSLRESVDWLGVLAHLVLPIAVFNALINIPGFWLFRRLEDRIYPMPRAKW